MSARAAGTSVLALLLFGCGEGEPPTPRKPRDSRWESIYFKAIQERLDRSGLSPLREATLPGRSCEVRIWAGFGLQAYPVSGHPLELIVLRREGDRFSGTRYPRAPAKEEIAPRSGWPRFWRRIEAEGLFDLPDATELTGYRSVLDGIAYVVEARRGGEYRTYHYGNPRHQDLPEAKRFLRLLEILRTETGFDS